MVDCLDSLTAPGTKALPWQFEEDFYFQNVLVFLAQNNIKGGIKVPATVLNGLAFFTLDFKWIRCFFFLTSFPFLPLSQLISSHQMDWIVAILSTAQYHKATFSGTGSSFVWMPAATFYLHHSQENHSCLRIGSTCCHCCRPGSRALTLSTRRQNSGVASDVGRKYLYILSFCLCADHSMSVQWAANRMWVMATVLFWEGRQGG